MNGKGAGVDTYMVLDDLVGKPMSSISSIALLNQFSVKNVGVLKEKAVTLGMNEIGTVIRLLTSQGMVGRLGNLYDSLENLDSKYIEPRTEDTSTCDRSINTKLDYVAPPGGLVKRVVTYLVLDDLVVKPMSIISSIILLKELGIKDVGGLKERVVTLGLDEALKLLKFSLQSKSVLTSVFMDNMKDEYL
ncbi:hypothetical protein FXO38_02487 [Capsicum annuum]|nr:hypothetical protein FXO38_02487 [Capsicum annuum]KAF3682171.1 hypothetical protein FXO37_02485 [Capsicum annuum]